jgi:uncharacterized protein
MRYRTAKVILAFFILSNTAWGAQFRDGLPAFRAGNYEAARDIWLPLAKNGNATAQFYLGYLYANDKGGIQKNHSQTVKWWRMAAEQGNAAAQFNLGLYYENGHGVERNLGEAIKLYRSAADQLFPQALRFMADFYVQGKGVPAHIPTAHTLYLLAAKRGDRKSAQILKRLTPQMTRAQLDDAKQLQQVGVNWNVKTASPLRNKRATSRTTNVVQRKPNLGKFPPRIRSLIRTKVSLDSFKELVTYSIDNSARLIGFAALLRSSDETFLKALPWLKQQAPKIAPKILYGVAERLLKVQPEQAPYWWMIGRIRLTYDVMRCTDKTAAAAVGKMNFLFRREVRRLGITNLKLTTETIESALAFDTANPPHKYSIIETCSGGMRSISTGLDQSQKANKSPPKTSGQNVPGHLGRVITVPRPKIANTSNWIKPANEHPAILKKVRDQMRKAIKVRKNRSK